MGVLIHNLHVKVNNSYEDDSFVFDIWVKTINSTIKEQL